MDRSIVLIGMKHSGKSTLADTLAWEMKSRNVDLDTLIEQEYRSDGLISCREIYSQHGKAFFQDLECRAAKRLAQEMQQEFIVASLGGGTFDNECARKTLVGAATFVYIVVNIEVLYQRIMKSGLPAFLSPEHPFEDFTALYERRNPLMLENADIVLNLETDSVEDSFQKLIKILREYGYAW